MSSFFNTVLYQPLEKALIFLYDTVAFQDLGIAIILLTLAVRIVLYPLFYKAFKNQTLMQMLQPEIQKIQHNHKDNREKQAQALMELYKQHKVNPFSGFLLILAQLPILIALYSLFLSGIPGDLNHVFLGLIDLKNRSLIMVGLAAAAQYWQGRLTLPKRSSQNQEGIAARISRQMVFIGPAITVLILYSLPAAVGLYWLATSVFSVFQQIIINKKVSK
jgi:YidC/Oxa1 family membrane protein insertase